VSEVGVSTLDLKDMVGRHGKLLNLIKSHHTLVSGREDFHPSPSTELRMGLPCNPAMKPRVWFLYGPHPGNTRWILAWYDETLEYKKILIAGDTESHPVSSLAQWVKDRVGALPAHGSVVFPVNPPVLRTPWVCDGDF
jgi:hypothetical protein